MANAVLDLIVKLKDEASAGLGNIGGALANLAGPAAAVGVAAAAAAAAVAGAAVAAVSATLKYSEALDSIGDVLGTSAADSAALGVAIEGVGGDTEKVTSQMSFMQKSLYGAKGALGASGLALQELGIDAKDAGFKSLGAADQMATIATEVNKMPDGLEKSTLMMKLFGKSGKDMSDTMGALADGGLNKARVKAREYGLALSDDAVAANLAFNRSVNDLHLMMKGFVITIGQALMPVILPMAEAFMGFAREHLPAVKAALLGVVNAIAGVGEWIKTLITAFTDAGEYTSSFAEQVGAALDSVFGLAEDGPGFFQNLGASIATAFDLIKSAVAVGIEVVKDFFAFFQTGDYDSFDGIGTALANVFGGDAGGWRDSVEGAATFIVNFIEGVKTTISNGLAAVAAFWAANGTEIMAFINKTWDSVSGVIGVAVELVSTIIAKVFGGGGAVETDMTTFQTIIRVAFDAVKLVIDLALGVIQTVLSVALALVNGDTDKALTILKDFFYTSWEKIKTFITEAWDKIKPIVQKGIDAIKEFVDKGLAALKEFVTTHFEAAVQAIRDKIAAAGTAASNFVGSILGAITSKAGQIKDAIVGPIESGIQAVLKLVADLQGKFNAVKDAVSNFFVPSAPTTSNPSYTAPSVYNPYGTRGSTAFLVDAGSPQAAGAGAGVIINVDARGASDDIEAKIRAGVEAALRQYGLRADTRIRMA